MHQVIDFNKIKEKYPKINVCLFDMDGTIMDTEFLHCQAINQVLLTQDLKMIDPVELESICIGINDEVVYTRLKDLNYLKSLSLEEFLLLKTTLLFEALKLTNRENIFNENVLELLKEIKVNKLKLGLVTSCEKTSTYHLLEFLSLTDIFDIIITREDTSLNKPHPEPYLKAMKDLGVRNPLDVLIFEDSDVGLKAAKSSKAHVYKVNWYSQN